MNRDPFFIWFDQTVDRLGPRLRELNRARERIRAMNKKRLELTKANNSLKKKIRRIQF